MIDDCRWLHRAVTGVVECSFAPSGFMDRLRFECRYNPPQRGFWSDGYPEAKCPCGKYEEATP